MKIKIILLTLFLIAVLSINVLGFTELNAGNLQEALESDKLIIVDFWASWCKYCLLLDPIIERLIVFNQEYNKDKIEWYKVDADKSSKFLNNFRPLRGLPVLVFYRNGKEVDRILGFMPFLKIQERINLLLKEEKKEQKDKKKDNCDDGVCQPPPEFKI